MNHYLFILIFYFLAFNILQAQPQTKATQTPKAVVSDPKIASVALISISSPEPFTNPKMNLLVYNTNAKIEGGEGKSFYFWNGQKWQTFKNVNLAVTKKMYVNDSTEITTSAARNMINVAEARRKQVEDEERKQIATNNAARKKDSLDRIAQEHIMATGKSETDMVDDDYDDLAGEMEDGLKSDISSRLQDAGDVGGDNNDFDILDEDGNGDDDKELMEMNDDDTKEEETPSVEEKDPDEVAKARVRGEKDEGLLAKMPNQENNKIAAPLGAFLAENQSNEPSGAKKKMPNPPVKARETGNNSDPVEEEEVAKTTENVRNNAALKEVENVPKNEEKPTLQIAETKTILDIKPEKAEISPKTEKLVAAEKKETENLIQNEPNSEDTNFMLGKNALSANENGINNTAVGHQALMANKIGSENTAIGESSLQNNVSGNRNIGIGYNALYSNVFASYNTAVGVNSLQNYSYANNANVFNSYNTAFGYAVLMHTNSINLETGMENTGVGAEALMANTEGKGNTGIGRLTLRNNTRGNFNTAIGYEALNSNTVGLCNTAFGSGALKHNITGEYNTAIGNSSGPVVANHALENTTAIGYAAITDADNQVRIGNNTVTSIGGYVGWTNLSDGRFKQNVKEEVKGLDFILQLRPVTYNLDMNALTTHLYAGQTNEMLNNPYFVEMLKAKSEVRYTGFIAQEVESAAKNTHFDFSGIDAPQNAQGHYGLRYAEFTVPLVKAVQEQQILISDLRAKIEILEKQNQQFASLAQEVEKLKMQLGMMGVINTPAENKR